VFLNSEDFGLEKYSRACIYFVAHKSPSRLNSSISTSFTRIKNINVLMSTKSFCQKKYFCQHPMFVPNLGKNGFQKLVFFLFFFFTMLRFELARKVLYHLSHASSPSEVVLSRSGIKHKRWYA
jgi:hypothetical protein